MVRNRVSSETGRLRKVIVHRPDDGIELITPGKALEFLYDDIVFLPRMREEHTLFTDVLSVFLTAGNVYDVQNLLLDIFRTNAEAKNKLLDYVIELEECDPAVKQTLLQLSHDDLVYTLFTGIMEQGNTRLFPPMPNYVFTRDIGVVVNDHVIICQAATEARTRESIITWCIIYYHPLFREFVQHNRVIDLTEEAERVTMEGGDVMVFDRDHLLIGCSSRTSPEAFEVVKKKLFEKNVVRSITKIEIPKERASMHIDTIFTQVSKNEFVVFAPYVFSEDKLTVTEYINGESAPKAHRTLRDFFLSVNPEMQFVLCGNGNYPYDEREQWTDGCNLLAVKDGVALAYDRNAETAQALREKGYKIVEAELFLEAFYGGITNAEKVERTIIVIPATELSRARGGPHCMSFPINRTKS